MLIECKIKRKGGSKVTMPNGDDKPKSEYHFKPLDPTRENSPHVAEVANDEHAQRFLAADPTVYRIFRASQAPEMAAPVTPAPPAEDPPPTADHAGGAEANPAADAGDSADAGQEGDGDGDGEDGHVTSMTLKDIRAGIASGELDAERLRELLEQEQQAQRPRSQVIAEITKALK